MRNIQKFKGIFPAFYACYDDMGKVSVERAREYALWLAERGVDGLYVGGSSGECIYQTVEERKQILESVMDAVGGRLAIIAHVACNGIAESAQLAAHAQALGVDAIAAIPPIYFHLPEQAICEYWNQISSAAPDTPFIVYNIPQLAGVALTESLLNMMLKNPMVIGVKNSSMPVMDIQLWKQLGGQDFCVFNGADEQLVAGLASGADGGIGGTYGVMPRLYLKLYALANAGDWARASALQGDLLSIIRKACSAKGNMYSVIKAILKLFGVNIGDARAPLPRATVADARIVEQCADMIRVAQASYLC